MGSAPSSWERGRVEHLPSSGVFSQYGIILFSLHLTGKLVSLEDLDTSVPHMDQPVQERAKLEFDLRASGFMPRILIKLQKPLFDQLKADD